jgi:hypothetical protein
MGTGSVVLYMRILVWVVMRYRILRDFGDIRVIILDFLIKHVKQFRNRGCVKNRIGDDRVMLLLLRLQFGMGNTGTMRFVVNLIYPKSMESYYQKVCW